MLTKEDFVGLSTRRITDAADTQMSQIQCHFGSKQGIILALFEHMNAGLLERQALTFDDPNLTAAQKWRATCGYLYDDFASDYVRVLQEVIAAGWTDDKIGDAVRAALSQWHNQLTTLLETATDKHGQLPPPEQPSHGLPDCQRLHQGRSPDPPRLQRPHPPSATHYAMSVMRSKHWKPPDPKDRFHARKDPTHHQQTLPRRRSPAV